MVARTHGQPASPTTLGKEIAVFAHRLAPILRSLQETRMTVKFGGATGTFAAWMIACPDVDWMTLTRDFLRETAPECTPIHVTAQADPHDARAGGFLDDAAQGQSDRLRER
jgi:adenylosuccinate lyase